MAYLPHAFLRHMRSGTTSNVNELWESFVELVHSLQQSYFAWPLAVGEDVTFEARAIQWQLT